MNRLQSIPVRVEPGADQVADTGNLKPILQQIQQALADLIENDAETSIDLGAMPFSEADERKLRECLGQGEVTARLDAFGPSLIVETAFPGVWLVEHQDAEERRLTLHVEIARVPQILVCPEADLADSLAALQQTTSADPEATIESDL